MKILKCDLCGKEVKHSDDLFELREECRINEVMHICSDDTGENDCYHRMSNFSYKRKEEHDKLIDEEMKIYLKEIYLEMEPVRNGQENTEDQKTE